MGKKNVLAKENDDKSIKQSRDGKANKVTRKNTFPGWCVCIYVFMLCFSNCPSPPRQFFLLFSTALSVSGQNVCHCLIVLAFPLVFLCTIFPDIFPGRKYPKKNCAVKNNFSEFSFHFPNFLFPDENRDINIHHIDDDIKRQRIHYSGDQIYPNVSIFHQIMNSLEKLIQIFFFNKFSRT